MRDRDLGHVLTSGWWCVAVGFAWVLCGLSLAGLPGVGIAAWRWKARAPLSVQRLLKC